MKRILSVIAAFCITLAVMAQAQFTTKKERLSDFTVRTTKIVMTGDIFVDNALSNAAKASWTISPFEICYKSEFEELRENENYYFLLPVRIVKKGDDGGLTYLTLVKGGSAELSDMLEVVNFPLYETDDMKDGDPAFFQVVMDIIQEYVGASLQSGFKPILGYRNASKLAKMNLVIADEDLSAEITPLVRQQLWKRAQISDAEGVDKKIEDGEDVLVAKTIVCSDAVPGNVCYKVIFDARTHELCLFRKHKVSGNIGKGFLKSDLKPFL